MYAPIAAGAAVRAEASCRCTGAAATAHLDAQPDVEALDSLRHSACTRASDMCRAAPLPRLHPGCTPGLSARACSRLHPCPRLHPRPVGTRLPMFSGKEGGAR
jgi:hypothetical protein